MENILGKPNVLKQVNLSIIRRVIKEKGSVTRAEIVAETKISVTTVRTLLMEMLDENEIMEVGYDESIGGRKAIRYQFKQERFFGISLCLHGEEIYYLIVDMCGEIKESGKIAIKGETLEVLYHFLDKEFKKCEIKSIGVGVPGIVDGLSFWRKDAEGNLVNYPIGERIIERYKVPVVLENDLNAIMLGFGRSFLKKFPKEVCEKINMAYLNFDNDCLSAGFLSDGRILRGWNNFVGELEFFPMDENRNVGEMLSTPLKGEEFVKAVVKIITAICCILNPQYIILGGENFCRKYMPFIEEDLNKLLPDKMAAQIIYSENQWQDYFTGIGYLTAEQIFTDLILVKEQIKL